MAEAGWHPKREAKRFEPPPWELDRFEALKQRGAEDEAAGTPAAERAEQPEDYFGEEPAEAVIAPADAVDVEARSEAREPEAETPPEGEGRKRESTRPPIAEAQLDAMLIQLGHEEPKVDEHLKPVGIFGSVIGMILGLSMFGWGVFGMMTARGQLAGVIGALIVMSMGLLFAVLGFVLGWRVTNKE